MLEMALQVISCEVKKLMLKTFKILWFLAQKKRNHFNDCGKHRGYTMCRLVNFILFSISRSMINICIYSFINLLSINTFSLSSSNSLYSWRHNQDNWWLDPISWFAMLERKKKDILQKAAHFLYDKDIYLFKISIVWYGNW